MESVPQAGGPPLREPSPPEGEVDLRGKVAGAASWTLGSMAAISFLRLLSQTLLSYLLIREYFGVIAIMRAFLMALQQLSDVGIRGSIVYHGRGEDQRFLNTAWTLQVVRGVLIWLGACALAWPVAAFYSENDPAAGVLLYLLPVSGFEAVINGFHSVRIFTQERRLSLKLPVILDWTSLVLSIGVTLVWAYVEPGVWALAAGPLVGCVTKLVLSHALLPDRNLRFAWERSAVGDLFSFGKWVFVGTVTAFLAQQFHVLYLGRAASLAVVGVYQLAWNFVVQSSKPLTMLSNRVMIPLFAQHGRTSPEVLSASVHRGLDRYLPACVLVCTSAGLLCHALFGYLYEESFADGGKMGGLLAVVVWFMILQHAPRSALLSRGHSRDVFFLTATNAVVTVVGCVVGFLIGRLTELPLGGVRGMMIGNALGNLAGCVVGARRSRAVGLAVGGAMVRYSVLFLVASAVGHALILGLPQAIVWLSEPAASLVATVLVSIPLWFVVWKRSLRDFLAERRSAKAQAAVQ